MGLVEILILAGIALIALFVIGLILTRLYRRASKEVSFVRTGWGGEKVIMNGGALVLPVLHEIIPVNMNTLRLEVRREANQALITRDRMRVDVTAEFYVRVKPTSESIATAAQTLGMKTMSPAQLKELVEGKFVDSLRAVAAEMAMEELHEKRVDFVQKVQQVVSEDLYKNGLELETVSLTGLDQTAFEFFNPQNAFDAEGLTRLTETIEVRRKKRNDIEQDTDLAIRSKNLETERSRLQILREEEYAKLDQEREIALRRAALGILRMLMQYGLDVNELIQTTFDSFPKGLLNEKTPSETADFMQARLAVLLQNDYPQDIVAAVLAKQPRRLDDLTAKLQAVTAFKQLPEAAALAAANKRVKNLLKKADAELGEVNESLLQQDEEKALYAAAQSLQPKIAAAVTEGNFQTALSELASVKPQVDAFFDSVMVMAEDPAVKQNRLNLLNRLAEQMNAVADIALLSE